MSCYYFEIVVVVKKDNFKLLKTHSNIRTRNMFDALQFIMLQYIDKENQSNITRSTYSELEISNTNYYCKSPLDFEIISAKCIEEVNYDDNKDYKEGTIRIDT